MVTTTHSLTRATYEELLWLAARSRVPRVRSLRKFAVDEIVIPEGKYRDQHLRIHRQPFAGLLLDELGSGRWPRSAVLGCIQAGKTLLAFVAPIMYYLFELQETTIAGIPTMDVSADKWREELLPTIEASRYRHLLPIRGPGSRGGTGNLTAVKFRNGVTLKFMTGHGGDEKRSAFTARAVVITEADKMDSAGEASREADPVSQLEGRTLSYDIDERRIHMECTVSIESGRIWKEYQDGTASRIVCPCPHCGGWVTPEREHLVGWKDAENEMAAGRLAYFACPDCGERITDAQRKQMNLAAVLVHRGQEVTPEGQVTGPLPETRTLGFRWNAFNNLFWSTEAIGTKEWTAARAEDEENAEKEMRQFYWALPYEPPRWDTTPLDARKLRTRFATDRTGKGQVPPDTKFLTMHVDPGKRVGWWMAVAWFASGSSRVIDYGTFEIPSDTMDIKPAMLMALRDLRDELVMGGWQTADGQARIPDQVLIDARYEGEVVYAMVRESGNRFRAVLGLGTGPQYLRSYHAPKKTNDEIRLVGDHYHVKWMTKHRTLVIEVDADHWKSFLHQRLATPQGQPGSMEFYYSTDRNEHTRLSKQLTAEKAVEEFVPGRGTIVKWVPERRANHYLDNGYNNCVAGHLLGIRLTDAERTPPKRPPRPAAPPMTMWDGRPYVEVRG